MRAAGTLQYPFDRERRAHEDLDELPTYRCDQTSRDGELMALYRSRRWQPSRRFSATMAILWLLFTAFLLDSSFTSARGGTGFGAMALLTLCLAGNWTFEWRRASRMSTQVIDPVEPPPVRTPEELRSSSLWSHRMLARVLSSPRNSALYGVVVSAGAAVMLTVMGAIIQSFASQSLTGLLLLTDLVILVAGPAGGLVAYYAMPKDVRDRFRQAP